MDKGKATVLVLKVMRRCGWTNLPSKPVDALYIQVHDFPLAGETKGVATRLADCGWGYHSPHELGGTAGERLDMVFNGQTPVLEK